MRRLGIYVFYDENGIADSYIDYQLKELSALCQDIYLLVNGTIRQNDLRCLQKYITCVYIRDNYGFDAGAYRDAFLKYISYCDWTSYDEIILMNDTAYGPVFPMAHLWKEAAEETIDFWGLTRHPKIMLFNGKVINSHIQSFFLVIRKRMLVSSSFLNFWKELPKSMELQDVIDNFEIKFTSYFEERGFRSKALMDDLELPCTDNPYMYYSYELVTHNKLPFIKKRCLCFQRTGYENALDALKYIEKEFQYDSDMIWQNIRRLCKEGKYDSILNYSELEDFYKSHKRIYIYGAGKYGRKMQKYFHCRRWTFEKFLVSDHADNLTNCSNYEDESFERSDGVILALGNQATKEVLEKIRKDLRPEQIFKLQSL